MLFRPYTPTRKREKCNSEAMPECYTESPRFTLKRLVRKVDLRKEKAAYQQSAHPPPPHKGSPRSAHLCCAEKSAACTICIIYPRKTAQRCTLLVEEERDLNNLCGNASTGASAAPSRITYVKRCFLIRKFR